MTALTDNPARAEEFGTRAQVLPLLSCASARRDRRGAQRSLDLTVRHSDSRRPAAPVPSPKEFTLSSSPPALNLFAERRHLDEERESTPAIGVPAKRRNRRIRFVGKRSNRAQAKGKPLFRAAFLQFSANCDAGAYKDARDCSDRRHLTQQFA